jgi:hypothetical protein
MEHGHYVYEYLSPFALLTAHTECPHCGEPTPVSAISTTAVVDPDDDEVTAATLIYDCIELPEAIAIPLAKCAAHYRPRADSSRPRWANHCVHCNQAIDERTLHESDEGVFFGGRTPHGASINVFLSPESLYTFEANFHID